MHGNEQMLCQYMEGSSKRFIIPVYQRNYDWQIEQCKQLFDDLVKLSKAGARSHFFGSIVSAQDDQSGMHEYLIIDGQQRLTTVSLMLLAMHNLLAENKIEASRPSLVEKILNEYLIDKYEPDATRIKLKPIKNDSKAFEALLDDTEDHVRASNITVNYNYFYNRILKSEISADELFDAFCRLQIISIFLGRDDNPQLIFESLNSTGLDLSEGDKIRNYILMDLKPAKTQEKYYDKYWHKIEQCTNYDVSSFVRDYLSIKMQSTPAMKKIYVTFKEFMERNHFDTRESLLEELLAYAKRYELLLKANGSDAALNACIDRLNRFEATVIRPFLMEVLRIADATVYKEEKISPEDLCEIFLLVESYIFRRQICDIPTNALNKVFVALNNEIIRYDGSINNYLEKCKYALLRKVSTGIYPDDGMFAEALSTKQVYLMRPKNKQYIMERLENWGTIEVKDVWKLIEEGTYTIEHIMPQTLQSEWKEMLGPDYESIHEEWVHRLANLTLTAYNSKYSNSTFQKKRDMENGFANSGIRMNQRIAKCDKWTLKELEERDCVLVERGLKIWPMIETSYEPPVKVLDAITLADEYSLKGRKVARFSFRGAEQTVMSWVDLFMKVMSLLHAENPLVLLQLASDKTGDGLSIFVDDSQENNNRYAKLEDGIFLWVNTNTETKVSLLRRFFKLYEVDEEDLIFYLRDDSDEELDEQNPLGTIRKRFWTQALPILKEKTKRFSNIHPTVSNWQNTFIGKAGLNISAIANLEDLRVELYIGTKDTRVNDDIFNFIKSKKQNIEQNAQHEFIWTNEPENRTAKISLEIKELGIQNESNWIACIEFLVEGVNIIAEHLLPEVEAYYS